MVVDGFDFGLDYEREMLDFPEVGSQSLSNCFEAVCWRVKDHGLGTTPLFAFGQTNPQKFLDGPLITLPPRYADAQLHASDGLFRKLAVEGGQTQP